jgi:signal transduction histidine kinase
MDGAVSAALARTPTALTRAERGRKEGGRASAVLSRRSATALLAAVAHEMRAPLTSMVMTTEMLADAAPDGDTPREAVARLRRGALWLRHLVDNLSISSLTEAGPIRLRCRYVPVLEAVAEVIELARPLLDSKQQRVHLHGDRRLVAYADPDRLDQILLNLLTNASKYSVEGDVLDVAVGRTRGRVTVEIADHGPGIAPAEGARVFEPYVRGAAAGSAGGLGLGLSIVRTLVDAHGGDVRVRETAGGGATFLVSLPRRASA